MGKIETLFFWLTVYSLLAAFLTQLTVVIFKKTSWSQAGWYMTLAAFAFQTATVADHPHKNSRQVIFTLDHVTGINRLCQVRHESMAVFQEVESHLSET